MALLSRTCAAIAQLPNIGAACWDARKRAVDDLEAKTHRRAVEGVPVAVYRLGQVSGGLPPVGVPRRTTAADFWWRRHDVFGVTRAGVAGNVGANRNPLHATLAGRGTQAGTASQLMTLFRLAAAGATARS